MLISLLLTAFAAPLAAPPQTSAVDYFPADTLAVVDFSLEPWDRNRKTTIAHPLLKDLKILKTMAQQAQFELDEIEKFEQDFNLRKALAATRIWVGLPATTLPAGNFLIGIDALKADLGQDMTLVFDRLNFPYTTVGTSILAIANFHEDGKMSGEDAQLVLSQIVEAASPKDGAVPYTLSNQKSWKKLHAELASKNRIFGMWMPSEPWRDGHFNQLLERLAGDEPDFSMILQVIDGMVEGFEFNKLDGMGVITEVSPPFIIDRSVILGEGMMMDLYTPYSTDPAVCWERLGQCDGASISSSVGGMDVPGLFDRFAKVMQSMLLDMLGTDILEDPEAKPYIDACFNVIHQFGPGFVTEASMERLDETGQSQMTLSVADIDKAKQSVANLPAEIIAGFQMGMAQSGNALDTEWGTDSLILMKDPYLTGESTLADSPAYLQTVPKMKKLIGDDAPVWLTYLSPRYDAYFLSSLADTVDFVTDMAGAGVLIDFSKLGSVSDLEPLMHPGFAVMTRQPGKMVVHAQSSFGFVMPALVMAARAVQQEMEGNTVFELEEDEF